MKFQVPKCCKLQVKSCSHEEEGENAGLAYEFHFQLSVLLNPQFSPLHLHSWSPNPRLRCQYRLRSNHAAKEKYEPLYGSDFNGGPRKYSGSFIVDAWRIGVKPRRSRRSLRGDEFQAPPTVYSHTLIVRCWFLKENVLLELKLLDTFGSSSLFFWDLFLRRTMIIKAAADQLTSC